MKKNGQNLRQDLGLHMQKQTSSRAFTFLEAMKLHLRCYNLTLASVWWFMIKTHEKQIIIVSYALYSTEPENAKIPIEIYS